MAREPSVFVAWMREIGARLRERRVLPPLPGRTPAGKLAAKRRPRMTLARGRWIPPRERQGRRLPVGAHVETRGRKR